MSGGPGDGMSHAEAYSAVIAGRPQSVQVLADALSDNGGELSSARAALQDSVDGLRAAWQGDTADRFIADIGTLTTYIDHLTTLLHGTGSSYAQALTQASADLATARKPANLPPPTQDTAKAAWNTYLQNDGNDALDPKRAAAYGRQEAAYQAQEQADRQQCIQTLNGLDSKYKTAAAQMQPPDPAPGVATSSSSGGSSGGSSAHSYATPTGTDSLQQGQVDGGQLTWVDGNGHTHNGHPPVEYPGYPSNPHPVIGGPTVTTHHPVAVDPQLAGLSTIDGSNGSGGLSSTEVAGLAALGAAGVIGGAAAMMRNRASAAGAAAITAAELEAREQAAERAALARARATMQSEQQSEMAANRSRLLASSEARAEQAAMARGTAGVAGRPMMRPGRGVIGGKDEEGSERTTWLQEDRGVWGVGEHVAPVVGGDPGGPADDDEQPLLGEAAADTGSTSSGAEPTARSTDRDDD